MISRTCICHENTLLHLSPREPLFGYMFNVRTATADTSIPSTIYLFAFNSINFIDKRIGIGNTSGQGWIHKLCTGDMLGGRAHSLVYT